MSPVFSNEDTQVLSVLDALEEDHRASQRELSKRTGLNLAKVNHLLRRLSEKGQIKLRNVSRNPNKLRYLYILTPHGLAEKSRLTVRFAARTWREYSRTLERFRTRLEVLTGDGGARVILLGANEVAEMVLEAAATVEGLTVVAVLDDGRAAGALSHVPIESRCDGLVFDYAIPCGPEAGGEQAAAFGLADDRLWLV
jgi:MarR family transcriptional regulator, temperature-dependent positive regulator of motility